MHKIHLDTDLGGDIDDLCALAMLLRWRNVELTGITTVAEAGGKRAGYTRYVLDLEGRRDIRVAAGADVSAGFYRYPELGYPAEERYWPERIEPYPGAVQDALQLLKGSIEQGATIIAIGPFTNLYLLDLQYPGILMQAYLFLMGGYIFPIRSGYPPWGNEMDWNVQVDVRSARHVLEHSSPALIPLTVTVETALRRADLRSLQKAGALGQLITRQAEAFAVDEQNEARYGATCKALPEDIVNFQHDALACAIALGWHEGVEIQQLPLIVEEKEGWLHERIDSRGKLTRVVTKVDAPSFNAFWLNKVVNVK
ncbi:MAG TPA: nucleoside hydrolase [Anaerolineales bacterium]|nr:nucleoside hydrolase [Anaerolineales bacterium]